jgi:hypothetical protein
MSETCGSADGVQRQIETSGWRRIGIDGVNGAGKSRLAQELSQALGIPVLDIDDYLHRHQGGYVDFMDYPALAAAIRSMPALILEGACLRQVLSNLGTDLDGHIYVMRMRNGLWADEDVCVFPDGVDAAIETLATDAAMIWRYLDDPGEHVAPGQDEDSLQLTFEVMRYHCEFQPHEAADVIYERGSDAA